VKCTGTYANSGRVEVINVIAVSDWLASQ